MNNLNFFIDAHLFDGPFQGSRSYLLGLYSETIKRMDSVHFFFGARNIENLKKEFGVHSNVTYIRYSTENKFFRLAINIPWIIKKYKIDISHFQYISPLFKFSREIVTIHDILFLDFPDLFPVTYRVRNRFMFRKSAARADLLLTVSEYSRSRISEHFRISKNNIFVLPNGILKNFVDRSANTPDVRSKYGLNKYLLYVSRIEPRKNHTLLIKAFYELALEDLGYKLIMIGTRSIPYKELELVLEQIPEKTRRSILFFEKIENDELVSFYRNCSLFIYPSIAEGFGIPVLEAMASGAPVICSGATALMDFEFIKSRMFDPGSLEELKKMIGRHLSSVEQNSENYTEIIRNRYSWKTISKRFVEIIDELLLPN
jgi:glycosyltransferase involved in cell wall biosynthesis